MRVINLFLMLLLIKTVALAQQKSNIQPSETNMSIELDEKEFRAVKAYLNEATKKTVVKPKFSEFLKKTLGNSYAETINKVKGKTPLKNGEISTDGCVLVVQKGGLYINNDTKQETSLKNDDKGGVKEKVSFTKDQGLPGEHKIHLKVEGKNSELNHTHSIRGEGDYFQVEMVALCLQNDIPVSSPTCRLNLDVRAIYNSNFLVVAESIGLFSNGCKAIVQEQVVVAEQNEGEETNVLVNKSTLLSKQYNSTWDRKDLVEGVKIIAKYVAIALGFKAPEIKAEEISKDAGTLISMSYINKEGSKGSETVRMSAFLDKKLELIPNKPKIIRIATNYALFCKGYGPSYSAEAKIQTEPIKFYLSITSKTQGCTTAGTAFAVNATENEIRDYLSTRALWPNNLIPKTCAKFYSDHAANGGKFSPAFGSVQPNCVRSNQWISQEKQQ